MSRAYRVLLFAICLLFLLGLFASLVFLSLNASDEFTMVFPLMNVEVCHYYFDCVCNPSSATGVDYHIVFRNRRDLEGLETCLLDFMNCICLEE